MIPTPPTIEELEACSIEDLEKVSFFLKTCIQIANNRSALSPQEVELQWEIHQLFASINYVLTEKYYSQPLTSYSKPTDISILSRVQGWMNYSR